MDSIAGTAVASPGASFTDISDSGVTITYATNGASEKFDLSDANTGLVEYKGIGGRCVITADAIFARSGNAYNITLAIFINSIKADESEIEVEALNTRTFIITRRFPVFLRSGDTIGVSFFTNAAQSTTFYSASISIA